MSPTRCTSTGQRSLPLIKRLLVSMFCWLIPLTGIQAAEITACIIDTSIKSNQVFYYFPLTKTLLRCDHLGESRPVSLNDLCAQSWRLIHMESPILVDQGKKNAAYTPPVLYLERSHAPMLSSEDKPTKPSTPKQERKPKTEGSSGGPFKWLSGDSASE